MKIKSFIAIILTLIIIFANFPYSMVSADDGTHSGNLQVSKDGSYWSTYVEGVPSGGHVYYKYITKSIPIGAQLKLIRATGQSTIISPDYHNSVQTVRSGVFTQTSSVNLEVKLQTGAWERLASVAVSVEGPAPAIPGEIEGGGGFVDKWAPIIAPTVLQQQLTKGKEEELVIPPPKKLEFDLLKEKEFKPIEAKVVEEVGKAKIIKEEAVRQAGDPIDRLFTFLSLVYGAYVGIKLGPRAGSCYPETPLEEDNCQVCSEFGMFCTEARCRILGPNCHPVSTEDADRMLCLKVKCSTENMPKGFPEVTEMKATAYIDMAGPPVVRDRKVLNDDLGILPWNATFLDLYVEADAKTAADEAKETKCRWSFEPGQKFEDMNYFDQDLFALEHTTTIDLSELAPDQDYTIYVKCRDICGAVPSPEDNPYWFKFSLEKEPDFVYPCYPDMSTAHDNGKCFIDPWQVYVPADLTTQRVQFWLNKKGDCRYSTSADNFTTEWQEMRPFTDNSPEMILNGGCEHNKKCLGLTGPEAMRCTHCNLILDLTDGERIDLNLTEEKLRDLDLSEEDITEILELMAMFQFKGDTGLFSFVVVCRDQYGNEMPALDYNLLTMPPFEIDIIKPPVDDEYERMPDIEVNTTHNTQCKYLVEKIGVPVDLVWDEMEWIEEEYAMSHFGRVEEELVPTGSQQTYTIYVKCRDEGRLEVDAQKDFTISRDLEKPRVIRMYHATDTSFGDFGNNLIIETNEPAECVYSIDNCAFNFTDGNAFIKDETGYLHSAFWQTEDNYYIKCKDEWDNYPGDKPDAPVCTIIISPYEVPTMY